MFICKPKQTAFIRETMNEAQKMYGNKSGERRMYAYKTYYICHNFRNAYVYKFKFKFMWTCVWLCARLVSISTVLVYNNIISLKCTPCVMDCSKTNNLATNRSWPKETLELHFSNGDAVREVVWYLSNGPFNIPLHLICWEFLWFPHATYCTAATALHQ